MHSIDQKWQIHLHCHKRFLFQISILYSSIKSWKKNTAQLFSTLIINTRGRSWEGGWTRCLSYFCKEAPSQREVRSPMRYGGSRVFGCRVYLYDLLCHVKGWRTDSKIHVTHENGGSNVRGNMHTCVRWKPYCTQHQCLFRSVVKGRNPCWKNQVTPA